PRPRNPNPPRPASRRPASRRPASLQSRLPSPASRLSCQPSLTTQPNNSLSPANPSPASPSPARPPSPANPSPASPSPASPSPASPRRLAWPRSSEQGHGRNRSQGRQGPPGRHRG